MRIVKGCFQMYSLNYVFQLFKNTSFYNTEDSQGISVTNPWKFQVSNLTIFS